MKKIFVFLLLMVVSFALKAQYPITQNLGGDSTLIYIKGAARTVGGFINGTYTDTTAANLTRIRQYQAAQIFTTGDSAIWFRSVGATKWIKMNAGGGGSPTTDTFYWRTGGNYITDTAGYRGILGTINNKPLIFMTNNQKRLVLTEDGLQNLGSTNKGFMMYDTTTGVWSYAAGGSGVYTAGNGLTLSGSQFKLGSPLTENTTITTTGYDFNLPGIPTVSSTTRRKVALIDTATGKVERIDPATLVTTPTLQQVLTAGSTLTTNNIIDANNTDFDITNAANVTISGDGTGNVSFIVNESGMDISTGITQIFGYTNDNLFSQIDVISDSILFAPYKGQMSIDSLRTWSGISDTTYKKPMTWDTRNGRWEYAANWYGGGGGTPAGSTKQFQYNNAGAFAGSGMLTQETNQILVTGVSDATTIPFAVEAHEDLTAPIILAAQSGVKKIALHSNGSIELQEVTDPTAAATGYNRLYAQSGKLYTHNDDGRVAQIVQDLQLKFGAGSGADADTTAFTTTALYGDYYTTDTIKVTSLRIVMQGTSPSVTVKIFYNDSLGVQAGATALVTAGNAVTNTTTGTNITSFDVSTIPPNVYVWAVTSTVGTKPKYLSIQLNGYRK